MAAEVLNRFRERTLKLRGVETKKRQGEFLEKIRADAVAVIGLASDLPPRTDKAERLERLLDKLRIASEGLRAAYEAEIAAALAMADETVSLWEAFWAEALEKPAAVLARELGAVQVELESRLRDFQESLSEIKAEAHIFERPPARLEELEARTAEFPLWARECLARLEMLGWPAPTLDPERIARTQADYAQGDHEALADVLSRVEAEIP